MQYGLYSKKLSKLYSFIIEDYKEANVHNVPKWMSSALKLVFFRRQHGNFPLEHSTYWENTYDMLSAIYRIEDVRPILIGMTEFEHVKTQARIVVTKKGPTKMTMPETTAKRCKMAAALYGLLTVLFCYENDFFKNMEAQIYHDRPEDLPRKTSKSRRSKGKKSRQAAGQ